MIAYVLLRVFVILLLVAANAFFAAAEFALVSVRLKTAFPAIQWNEIIENPVPKGRTTLAQRFKRWEKWK